MLYETGGERVVVHAKRGPDTAQQRHALFGVAPTLLGGVAAVGTALLVGPYLGSLLAAPFLSFWQHFCTDVRSLCVVIFATMFGMLFGFGQLGWLD